MSLRWRNKWHMGRRQKIRVLTRTRLPCFVRGMRFCVKKGFCVKGIARGRQVGRHKARSTNGAHTHNPKYFGSDCLECKIIASAYIRRSRMQNHSHFNVVDQNHLHSSTTRSCVSSQIFCIAANQDGRTPLHWVSDNGHVEVVKLLLENKADVNAANQDGQTPLHWASQNWHGKVVKLLSGSG